MRWGEGKEENRAIILLIFLLKAVNFNITLLSLPVGVPEGTGMGGFSHLSPASGRHHGVGSRRGGVGRCLPCAFVAGVLPHVGVICKGPCDQYTMSLSQCLVGLPLQGLLSPPSPNAPGTREHPC